MSGSLCRHHLLWRFIAAAQGRHPRPTGREKCHAVKKQSHSTQTARADITPPCCSSIPRILLFHIADDGLPPSFTWNARHEQIADRRDASVEGPQRGLHKPSSNRPLSAAVCAQAIWTASAPSISSFDAAASIIARAALMWVPKLCRKANEPQPEVGAERRSRNR